MNSLPSREDPDVVDVAGIGFGPANLALAIALHETDGHDLTAAFFERQPEFGWHRGMLIEDATMQISFLKDLATMRDPRSEFSFLCYLHDKGRLVDFINHQILMPSRMEFHDYLAWAAAKLDHVVSYGAEVLAVHPVEEHGRITHLDVETAAGSRRARNVVVATGLVPDIPQDVQLSDRVWHSSRFVRHLRDLPDGPHRFTVVGAGQSAAEITNHLLDRFPRGEVNAVFARRGYSVADDSPFANRIFDPESVDHFHGAPPDVKKSLLSYHASTNYSVVDLDLTKELYRRHYQELVRGTERLRLFHTTRVHDLRQGDAVRLELEFLPTGEHRELVSDFVIYATGYRPKDPRDLLGDLAEYVKSDDEGNFLVDRNYRLVTTDDIRCGVYVQGGATEHTHGISSGLLSTTAVRAAEITRALIADGVCRARA